MKTIFSTEFKVGLTVIVSTLILIFGIIWGKGFQLQPNKYTIQVEFENVGGMIPGDPVTVNGVKEGKISDIGWNGRNVVCTLEINDEVQLYEDATFTVISAELLAGMKVEIFPGKSKEKINMSHQPFQGKYGGRIVDVGMTIDDLARDLSALTFRIDTTMVLLNNMLKSGQLQNDLQTSLANISELTNGFKGFPNDLKHTLQNVDSAVSNLNNMVNNNDQDLSSAIRNLNSISSRLDTVASSMRVVLGKVENKEGTLGKMIYDTTMYHNLNRTMMSIDSLAKQIKNEGLNIDLF